MALDFQPTPSQAGHAIGLAVFNLTSNLWGAVDDESLRSAGITVQQYRAELLLLAASAAMHAIESAGLTPDIESKVAGGLFAWVRSLSSAPRELLLTTLDEATDMYAESFAIDKANPRPVTEVADIEEAFGERLLAMGENNAIRGPACVRLALVIPRALWPAQYSSARQMLQEAGLVSLQ